MSYQEILQTAILLIASFHPTCNASLKTWLGQDICALHAEKENATYGKFRVKKIAPDLSRKQRYSEIDGKDSRRHQTELR